MSSPLIQRAWLAAALVAAALCAASVVPAAVAEQASSDTRRIQAGYLDAALDHGCAALADRTLRCWGNGLAGKLGYGGEQDVPSAAAAGPVNLGPGRSVRTVATGRYHTCAIVDDGTVRCWGFGANGRLGYGGTADVQAPWAAGPVDIGPARTAVAITAGASHTCVIRDDGRVLCWGNGVSGRLGYGNQSSVGDNETPGSVGPVDIGPGRTAVAITAGDFHTCAIRDDGSLLCWGFGSGGQLGLGGTGDVGDDETPAQQGPVDLNGRRVRAVSGGFAHTCAILDDGSARCWGFGADGVLGYGSEASIDDASEAGPIDLGPGRTAVAISAGGDSDGGHACAILDTGAVRCWGRGADGRLGYGSTQSIGDQPGETPASAGPVALGAGRTARALSAGYAHTCVALDDGTVRCWGSGGDGRLGYGNDVNVGDSPARSVVAAGPVPIPGVVPPLVADLSLAATASAAEVPVGGSATVTVTVANAGVDAAAAAVSMPAPPALAVGAASGTQGSYAAGAWQVGSLAPGATATLQVAVSPTGGATNVVTAEVAASSVYDPDSVPGNGAPNEDDIASIGLVTPAAAAVPVPLPPRPRGLRITARRLPKSGVARRIRISGTLLLPRTRPVPRCSGRVRARARVGSRAVATRTTVLRSRGGACRYATVLRLRRTGSAYAVIASARFLGTAQMRARTSRNLRVQIRPDRRPVPRLLTATATALPARAATRAVAVRGVLLPPRGRRAPRCAGRVELRLRARERTLTRRAVLRARGGTCRYATTLRPRPALPAGVARVSARFLGNANLKPRSARAQGVRVR